MSESVAVEKCYISTNVRKTVKEPVAREVPVNIFVNNDFVITLLATPQLKKELTLGWLFDEGVLHSLREVRRIVVTSDCINVLTDHPVGKERLQMSGVSRLLTTACGLTTEKFFSVMSEANLEMIQSKYSIEAAVLIRMVEKLGEGRLYQTTGGVHVAALFEENKLIALAEDVGRHNTVDKVIGIALQSNVNFNKSVLVSSGRQPADMVLKAARMKIPIVVSKAAPIFSGIITAEKTGITLVCFVKRLRMNVYTHHHRIQLNLPIR